MMLAPATHARVMCESHPLNVLLQCSAPLLRWPGTTRVRGPTFGKPNTVQSQRGSL